MKSFRLRQILDVLALPGNARVIAVGGIFLTCGTAIWWPLFALFLASEGIGYVVIGTIFAAGTATSIVSAPLGGLLADRYSRKNVIVVAAAANSVGTLSLALTSVTSQVALPLIVGSFASVSFGGSLASGAIRALLFESSPPSQKGAAMSSPYVLPSFAAIPMPFLGSVLSQSFSWSFVFAVGGVLVALACVAYFLLLRETKSDQAPSLRDSTPRHPWLGRAALLSPVGALFGVYAMVGFGQGATSPFMPLYFTSFLGSSVQFFGMLTSIEMATVGVLALVSGKLVDRLGALSTIVVSFAGEAFVLTALVFVRNIVMAGVLYETWGAVDWFDLTAPSVFIGSHVQRQSRATAIASFGVVTRLPGLIAPGIGGVLFIIYPPLIIMLYAAIVTASTFLILFLRKRESRRMAVDLSLHRRDPSV